MYQADYKDARQKLLDLKKEGPVKVNIPPIQNNTNYSNLNLAMHSEVYKDWNIKGSQFVNLVSAAANPDLRMECELSSVNFSIENHEPYVSNRTEKIGKNEQIVKAKLTTNGRTAYVDFNYNYHIIDVKTGENIETQVLTKKIAAFQDTWYSYLGDSRALSKNERTKTSPESVPSKTKLMDRSLLDFKKAVIASYSGFMKPYGH
jgi:hypothetical protein